MMIDPALWPKLHGASVHFPIAMAMGAALFDGLGLVWSKSSTRKAQFHSAGYFTIILGALGTIPAVLSGLFMTKGGVMGHGALLFHHLFVWPAFASLIGLGIWRAMNGNEPTRGFAVYLTVLFLTAGLIAGAGYWGGELILASPEEDSTAQVMASPEMISQGQQFFAMSCSHCHGDDAHGDEGPDLHNLAISDVRIAATIKKGIKGEMPTFTKKYNDQQIAAIVSYLRTLK